jgi:hypothetical protein
MKPIVFLINDISCLATTQCGVVVNHVFTEFNINSSIRYRANDGRYEIDDIKDSIVIMCKHLIPDAEIEILKKNNNKIVIDVVDEFIREETNVLDLYDYSKIDGIISRIKKVVDDYQFLPNLAVVYIPHHWDIRLQDVQPTIKNINYKPALIANDLRDMPHLPYLYDNKLIDFHMNISFDSYNEYIDIFKKYNFHYNVRETNSVNYKFKPASKLVTAAALNTPLITNYDWSLRDLIPEDYPFLIQDTSLDSILNTINSIDNVSDSQYNYALEILADVKYKTALVNLVPAYINFFEQL